MPQLRTYSLSKLVIGRRRAASAPQLGYCSREAVADVFGSLVNRLATAPKRFQRLVADQCPSPATPRRVENEHECRPERRSNQQRELFFPVVSHLITPSSILDTWCLPRAASSASGRPARIVEAR